MRAVLVNLAYPRIPWRFRQESLGLAYLAAVARRAGHDVDIIDASPGGWTAGQLVRLIMESDRGAAVAGRRSGPVGLVGVSILFQEPRPPAGPAGPTITARPLIANLDDLPFPARDTLPAYLTISRGPRAASLVRSVPEALLPPNPWQG